MSSLSLGSTVLAPLSFAMVEVILGGGGGGGGGFRHGTFFRGEHLIQALYLKVGIY